MVSGIKAAGWSWNLHLTKVLPKFCPILLNICMKQLGGRYRWISSGDRAEAAIGQLFLPTYQAGDIAARGNVSNLELPFQGWSETAFSGSSGGQQGRRVLRSSSPELQMHSLGEALRCSRFASRKCLGIRTLFLRILSEIKWTLKAAQSS